MFPRPDGALGLHQFKSSALWKHLLLQRYWKRKDFQNKTLRKWNAAPKNRLSQRLQCPSRADALRLCHAPTAKATPSWAHGGATPAAPCTTNHCPASRMAIEWDNSRHSLRHLSPYRLANSINSYHRDCPTITMLLHRKMVHITHWFAPLFSLLNYASTEKTSLKIGALP